MEEQDIVKWSARYLGFTIHNDILGKNRRLYSVNVVCHENYTMFKRCQSHRKTETVKKDVTRQI